MTSLMYHIQIKVFMLLFHVRIAVLQHIPVAQVVAKNMGLIGSFLSIGPNFKVWSAPANGMNIFINCSIVPIWLRAICC